MTSMLGKKGHELVADIRFQDNIEKESSDFLEQYFTSDNSPSGIPDRLQ